MSTKKKLRGRITAAQLEWMVEIQSFEQKLRDGGSLTNADRHCVADWLAFACGMIQAINWLSRGTPVRASENWKYANVCTALLNQVDVHVSIKSAAAAAIGPGRSAQLATVQKYCRLLRAGKGTRMGVSDAEILEAWNRLAHSGCK